jgi:8-oxo-dGTP pyrophosphatase MutT (NUDIX family)
MTIETDNVMPSATQNLIEIENRLTTYRQHIGEAFGDHVLNPHYKNADPLRPAAVLLTLIDREDGPQVLFTRRTDHLAHHPGQISFPGGHVDDEDDSPETTALRETEEECGIIRTKINVIGRINTYLTGTGFSVTPIVGVIRPPFDMTADPVEVAEIFEVPLSFIMDPRNHQRETRIFDGDQKWYTYAMPYLDYHIWGITAGILRNFYEIIADEKIDVMVDTNP